MAGFVEDFRVISLQVEQVGEPIVYGDGDGELRIVRHVYPGCF